MPREPLIKIESRKKSVSVAKCEACKAWESETGYGKICDHANMVEVISRAKQWGAAEERKRILGLKCLEIESENFKTPGVSSRIGKNELRRELKKEINI